MTENVVDIFVRKAQPDEPGLEEIVMGAWDVQLACEEYLLQNGQIKPTDEIGAMSITLDADNYPQVAITIKKGKSDGDN